MPDPTGLSWPGSSSWYQASSKHSTLTSRYPAGVSQYLVTRGSLWGSKTGDGWLTCEYSCRDGCSAGRITGS